MCSSIVWKFVGYGTFVRIFTRVAAALGYAYAVAGRVGEALPLLNLANERFQLGLTSARAELAQGYLLIGKLEEADLIASRRP